MTIARLNKKIAPLGIECVKDAGYFYFMELDGTPFERIPASVYVPRFNDLPMDQWIAHATDKREV